MPFESIVSAVGLPGPGPTTGRSAHLLMYRFWSVRGRGRRSLRVKVDLDRDPVGRGPGWGWGASVAAGAGGRGRGAGCAVRQGEPGARRGTWRAPGGGRPRVERGGGGGGGGGGTILACPLSTVHPVGTL